MEGEADPGRTELVEPSALAATRLWDAALLRLSESLHTPPAGAAASPAKAVAFPLCEPPTLRVGPEFVMYYRHIADLPPLRQAGPEGTWVPRRSARRNLKLVLGCSPANCELEFALDSVRAAVESAGRRDRRLGVDDRARTGRGAHDRGRVEPAQAARAEGHRLDRRDPVQRERDVGQRGAQRRAVGVEDEQLEGGRHWLLQPGLLQPRNRGRGERDVDSVRSAVDAAHPRADGEVVPNTEDIAQDRGPRRHGRLRAEPDDAPAPQPVHRSHPDGERLRAAEALRRPASRRRAPPRHRHQCRPRIRRRVRRHQHGVSQGPPARRGLRRGPAERHHGGVAATPGHWPRQREQVGPACAQPPLRGQRGLPHAGSARSRRRPA